MDNPRPFRGGKWISDLALTNNALLPSLALGFFFILIHFEFRNWTTFATASLWAAACLVTGAAFGFLFGIPRVVQSTEGDTKVRRQSTDAPGGDDSSDSVSSELPETDGQLTYRQLVNSNLVEISDWLTKIIVGLGLVNLKGIPTLLDHAAKKMAGGLSPSLSDQYAFSIATIVSFGVLGFLMGYLYTRLFLAGAFSRADRNSIQAARERRGADLVEKATTILRQELPAGANQSDQKVTDGQVAAAQRVRDLPQARDPESALAALRSLAREYDQVRAEMASGRERTDRMTKIVHTMRALALAGYGELDRFARSPNSAGERLVAIAMLQVQPDPTYFPWLIERISHEQPFVAFQAIEALHRAAVSPDPRIVDTVRGLIDQWISTADFKNLVAVENDRSELFIFILKTLGIRY